MSIFSSAPMPISRKSKTQGTRAVVRKGCQITQHPALGAISPNSRKAETPTANSGSAQEGLFPGCSRATLPISSALKEKAGKKSA